MNQTVAKKTRRAWWVVAAYCLVIFVGSSIPGTAMPDATPPDKLLHTVEYIVLGAVIMYALLANTRWTVGVAFVVAVGLGCLFGASDELHQMLTPRRDSSLLDLVADALGSTIGAGLIGGVALLRRRG